MCGQEKGSRQGEEDCDAFAGARPAALAQAHPDDDENEAEVLEDGAGAGVGGADDAHVAELAGRQAEDGVGDEWGPVTPRCHQFAVLGGDPARAGERTAEGEDAGRKHAEEADEGQFDAVGRHQIVGGDPGSAPAQRGHDGHDISDGVTHEVPSQCPRDDSNVRHPL